MRNWRVVPYDGMHIYIPDGAYLPLMYQREENDLLSQAFPIYPFIDGDELPEPDEMFVYMPVGHSMVSKIVPTDHQDATDISKDEFGDESIRYETANPEHGMYFMLSEVWEGLIDRNAELEKEDAIFRYYLCCNSETKQMVILRASVELRLDIPALAKE